MARQRKRSATPLAQEIATAIQAAVGQGCNCASQHDLTHWIGRKITHSFRAAMDELERDGVVTKRRVRTDAGGLMVIYDLHPAYAQQPLNAPPF